MRQFLIIKVYFKVMPILTEEEIEQRKLLESLELPVPKIPDHGLDPGWVILNRNKITRVNQVNDDTVIWIDEGTESETTFYTPHTMNDWARALKAKEVGKINWLERLIDEIERIGNLIFKPFNNGTDKLQRSEPNASKESTPV